MQKIEQPEPWLRGTLTDVPAVQRGVLHALELAREDLARWTADLSDIEMNVRPGGIASVAFHLRHIARSLDRLLTYAENQQLSSEQLVALKTESETGAKKDELWEELTSALAESAGRIRAFSPTELEHPRYVGRKQLPATVGGLLVHVADHTQRHVGQAITTARLVLANRSKQSVDE
jgi:uncharacterized damage-inducible protein DinB